MESSPFIEVVPGVQKKILVEGFGELPKGQYETVVHFSGKLPNGYVFDSSIKACKPFKFQLSGNQVIKGWDIGVMTMKRGEKALFHIHNSLAYGIWGSAPSIPPNTDLDYEIEVLDFYESKMPPYEFGIEERVKKALELKEEGNKFYKSGRPSIASYTYQEALKFIEDIDFPDKQNLLTTLQSNVCVVANANKYWDETVKFASMIISRIKDHSKARYLRGIAYFNLNVFDDSVVDLNFSLMANPNDEKIKKEYLEAKAKLEQSKMKNKKIFKNVFGEESELVKAQSEQKEEKKHGRVFMMIKKGIEEPKRVEFELFADKLPLTCHNFMAISAGHPQMKDKKLSYRNTNFFKLTKGFILQGGDIEKNDGSGGESVYGKKFDDEGFFFSHDQAGILSMANNGKNSNNSQFFITLNECKWLDKTHVAFGKVISGMEHIKKIEETVEMKGGKLSEEIVIVDCGIIP